jgi:hypothetical protein
MEVRRVVLKGKSTTAEGIFDAFRRPIERPPPGHVLMGVFEELELTPEGIKIETAKDSLWFPWTSIDHLDLIKSNAARVTVIVEPEDSTKPRKLKGA